MNSDYVKAIGFVLLGLGEVLTNPSNAAVGFTDILKGLGMFGLHRSITAAMQLPPGQAVGMSSPPQSQ